MSSILYLINNKKIKTMSSITKRRKQAYKKPSIKNIKKENIPKSVLKDLERKRKNQKKMLD